MSTCAICYEDVSVETGCVTLSCSHEFHFLCISSWFLNTHNQSSCPCCRKVMTPMEDVPSGFKGSDAETYYAPDQPWEESEFIPDEEPYLYFTYSQLNEILRNNGSSIITMYTWMTMMPVNGQVCFEMQELKDFMVQISVGNQQAPPQLTNEECNRIRATYWPHNQIVPQTPTTPLFLMSDGTWQESMNNPEDDTGVQMAVPLGAAAPILSKVLVKKIQKKWRSTRQQLQAVQQLQADAVQPNAAQAELIRSASWTVEALRTVEAMTLECLEKELLASN